ALSLSDRDLPPQNPPTLLGPPPRAVLDRKPRQILSGENSRIRLPRPGYVYLRDLSRVFENRASDLHRSLLPERRCSIPPRLKFRTLPPLRPGPRIRHLAPDR